jgi:putative nucleotidyltransferase with HDIG domain
MWRCSARRWGSGDPVTTAPLTQQTETRVLIVDDELAVRKVLAAMLEQAGITCVSAGGATEALRVLQTRPIDAVIADLQMPGNSGMDLLAEVRKGHPQLVFLMATGVDDARVGVAAMRQGADDYLIKPLDAEMVMVSLDRAFYKKNLEHEVENYRRHLEEMVGKRTVELRSALERLESSYSSTLDALGSAIDLRDSETAGHSRRVCLYSVKMLKALNGKPEQLENVARGAWLHDIGKLAIPDAILLKPGPLTIEERQVMEQHVEIGYELVRRIPFLAEAAEIIFMHHERCDGSGYPRRLKGKDISLGAKIFAVADTLDAMTSNRPYRKALSFEDARREIESKRETQFDANVVDAFLSIPIEVWKEVREQMAELICGAAARIPTRNAGDSSGTERAARKERSSGFTQSHVQ